MDVESYRRKKKSEKRQFRSDREICTDCWQPDFNCYCHVIEKFDAKIEFVILIHPSESRRRIATGRMAYQSLMNSHIFKGCYFTDNQKLTALATDTNYRNIILSPGLSATNLTGLPEGKIQEHFPQDKKLRIYVIDSTWSNVGKMLNNSPALQKLRRYFFTPDKPSNIRVRKQPNSNCYCTLEAIHHTIELLGPSQGFDTKSREHDNLLKPFNWMVERQLERIKTHRNWRIYSRSSGQSN